MRGRLDHHHQLQGLADLLSSNNHFLCTHPNDLELSIVPSSWAVSKSQLLEYYITGSNSGGLPEALKILLDSIRALQLPRSPINLSNHELLALPTRKGMSPKKMHEVQRMASYVKLLVKANEKFLESNGIPLPLHIVDVGAGKGYLTRVLASIFPSARILALDADEGQKAGAERLGKAKPRRTNADAIDTTAANQIEHRTILVTPESLLSVIGDWVGEKKFNRPVPVMFVALHACGSLTPDILRAFMIAQSQSTAAGSLWYPFGVVGVGCCYNLMYPDYPLSAALLSYPPATVPPLPVSAFHLAAQIPQTWLVRDNGDTNNTPPIWKLQPSIEFATRKVAWRALLGHALLTPYVTVPHPPPNTQLQNKDGETLQDKLKKSADVPVKWWLQSRSAQAPTPHSSDFVQSNEPLPAPSIDYTLGQEKKPSFNRLPTRTTDTSLQQQQLEGLGQNTTSLRLGKLPDSAYTQGWSHFLAVAGEKMGVSWNFDVQAEEKQEATPVEPKIGADCLREAELEQRIEALHVIRSLLGPAVESAILLDRLVWVQEELSKPARYSHHGDKEKVGTAEDDGGSQRHWRVDLVNLFNQKTGSGRNVGIVIAPEIPAFEESEE